MRRTHPISTHDVAIQPEKHDARVWRLAWVAWVFLAAAVVPRIGGATETDGPVILDNGSSEQLSPPRSEVPDGEPDQLDAEPNWRIWASAAAETAFSAPGVSYENTGSLSIFLLERPPQTL
ncbi:MAG: hypothetical protein JXX29_19830 [Deltaproteobacteria bacterium]|nr:hypothetical protein [Deltaproteobacteria bacterium]MBN2673941.1 hypothetical protein [Deltaproteobacteria bacterium]